MLGARRLGVFDLLIYWFGPREPFQLGKVHFIKDSLVVCEGCWRNSLARRRRMSSPSSRSEGSWASMAGGEEEDEKVVLGAAEDVKGRGETRVRSSGDGQRELRNEDVGGDRPRTGSLTEQAVSFAHGRREEPDFHVAMIVKRIARGRKVPQYAAIVGEAEEIRLTAPTHSSLDDEDRELLGLKAGDLVSVRYKNILGDGQTAEYREEVKPSCSGAGGQSTHSRAGSCV